MKKLNIYLSALLALAFTACTENFDPEVGPQTYLPESELAATDVTMTSGASAINIQDYIDSGEPITIGTVAVAEGAMPANTILKATVDFSTDPTFEKFVTIPAASLEDTDIVTVSANDLQDEYFNNITRNPKTVTLYMRTTLYTVTNGEAVAIVGKPGENYYAEQNVSFTPLFKVQISPAYYVIGAKGGWSADGARTQQFEHSDVDVYDDPIFSIVIDSGGDDCWFAIGDDEALNSVAAGDWTKLLGTKGESEDLTGSMDFRYNLGGEHSFHVTNAKKIRITLNMMEYTYTIEPVNIADAYYLIGGPGEWNATSAMTMQFSHSNRDVFEDPVFTYTFAGNGGDMWFAFGDKEAIDAVADGTWNKLFGTKGESTDLSGNFDYRYNLDGEHSFCVDGKAKYYRLTINMLEYSYKIETLDFAEFIYVPGNAQKYNTSASGMPEWGWTPELAPALRSANFDGVYTGYAYMDGEFKFTKARDWSAEYNYDSFGTYDAIFTGTPGTGGNINCTEPGYYQLVADVASGSLKATKLTWGLVGPATPGGWDASAYTVMTYNMADDCWEITTALAADQFKFTTNGSWDINLGGTADDLVENGDNLSISEAGTYTIKLYPSRAQNDKMYATIVKK